MTHRFHWPVTTIRHHQPGIIMFNRFYLGPASNSQREWMDFSNYFCLNTRGEVPSLVSCDYLVSLCFHSGSATFPPSNTSHFYVFACLFRTYACALFCCFWGTVVACYCKNKIHITKCISYIFINISHKRRIFYFILIFRTETSVRLVFYLQMDSEGEELTLKTCNSSTGKDGFLKSAYNHNTRTHAHMHVPLTFMG